MFIIYLFLINIGEFARLHTQHGVFQATPYVPHKRVLKADVLSTSPALMLDGAEQLAARYLVEA